MSHATVKHECYRKTEILLVLTRSKIIFLMPFILLKTITSTVVLIVAAIDTMNLLGISDKYYILLHLYVTILLCYIIKLI